MKRSVLAIDDDALILESLEMILHDMEIEITTASNANTGVELARQEDFGLILTDIRMPGMDGAEVVREILTTKPTARILVVTAFPGDPAVQRALTFGALGIMKKPFEISKILEFIK